MIYILDFAHFPGGRHHYGTLRSPDRSTTAALSRSVDERMQATYLDEGDRVELGEPTERFDSREDVILAAREWLRQNGQPGDKVVKMVAWLIARDPDPLFTFEDVAGAARTADLPAVYEQTLSAIERPAP